MSWPVLFVVTVALGVAWNYYTSRNLFSTQDVYIEIPVEPKGSQTENDDPDDNQTGNNDPKYIQKGNDAPADDQTENDVPFHETEDFSNDSSLCYQLLGTSYSNFCDGFRMCQQIFNIIATELVSNGN